MSTVKRWLMHFSRVNDNDRTANIYLKQTNKQVYKRTKEGYDDDSNNDWMFIRQSSIFSFFLYDLQRQMGFACLVYSHVWIYGWCAGAKRRSSLLSFIDIADRETCYNDDKFLLFLIISAWMHICLFSSFISIVFCHPQV
jgi:hypothetical protein